MNQIITDFTDILNMLKGRLLHSRLYRVVLCSSISFGICLFFYKLKCFYKNVVPYQAVFKGQRIIQG